MLKLFEVPFADDPDKVQALMQIGGEKIQLEGDEVAFRCRLVDDGTVQKVEWLRYIAFAKRGGSKIFLEQLPSRLQAGSGRGGGGALSIEELERVLRIDTDRPLLLPRSVLHTDSAKAYRRVGPMRWPENGAL